MKILRAIVAVVVGYVLFAGASMFLLRSGLFMMSPWRLMVVVILAALALIGLVVGSIARLIAGEQRRLVSYLLAGLVALVTLVSLIERSGVEPTWYKLGTLVLIVPAILLIGVRGPSPLTRATEEKSTIALKTLDRWVFGMLLPLVILFVGMLGIASLDSRAGAAEFAGLGVFFMLLFSLPFVLVINPLLVFGNVESRKACFWRGMILPAVVFLAAIVYQSGLWDRLTCSNPSLPAVSKQGRAGPSAVATQGGPCGLTRWQLRPASPC